MYGMRLARYIIRGELPQKCTGGPVCFMEPLTVSQPFHIDNLLLIYLFFPFFHKVTFGYILYTFVTNKE